MPRFLAAVGLCSVVGVALAVGACGSKASEIPADSAPQPGATTTTTSSATGAPAPNTPDGSATNRDGAAEDAGVGDAGAQGPTIFTVLMENHDYDEIVGSADAPFFNELIAKYGLATNYSDCNIHPSLPNYLCLISGAPQYAGIIDLDPTQSFITGTFPVDKPNLGTQLLAANIPWRSYQESMGTPCRLSSVGDYAPKHDPFLYFKDIQKGPGTLCADRNVDLTMLPADLAANAQRYYFVTPNLVSDGHNPANDPPAALRVSDTWARAEIGKIMASPAYRANGIIFITWDEAEGRNGHSKDKVPMIIVSERIKSPGFKSAVAYSHKSYLATVETLLGLPRLATVTAEPTMMEFFR